MTELTRSEVRSLMRADLQALKVPAATTIHRMLDLKEEERTRAIARYLADEPPPAIKFEALWKDRRAGFEAIYESKEGWDLARGIGSTSGGRDLGRYVVDTELITQLAHLLAGNRKRLDWVRDLARTDLGKKVAEYLAFSTEGRHRTVDLLTHPEVELPIQTLSASRQGRTLARDLATSRAGKTITKYVRGGSLDSGLADLDPEQVAGALLATAIASAHIGATTLVASTIETLQKSDGEGGPDEPPSPFANDIDNLAVVPRQELDSTDVADLSKALEPFLGWVHQLIQSGHLDSLDQSPVEYALGSVQRELRDNPTGPDPRAVLHWQSRLFELTLRYLPGSPSSTGPQEDFAREAAQSVAKMSHLDAEGQGPVAIEAAAEIGGVIDPQASRAERLRSTARKVGWISYVASGGAAIGVTLGSEYKLPRVWMSVVGAILGILAVLFRRE